jgi:hypothetical protein
VNDLSLANIPLFIIFVFPGLLSLKVYGLIIASDKQNWSNAILEGLFFSILNFVLLSPVIYYLSKAKEFFWYHYLLVILTLVIAPVIWPCIYKKITSYKRFKKYFLLPHITSFDYYFDRKEPVFVRLRLKNGEVIGGYFGNKSYASGYPTEGDLYLEAVYSISEDDDKFLEPIEGTDGLLITKDEYCYMELLSVPKPNEES